MYVLAASIIRATNLLAFASAIRVPSSYLPLFLRLSKFHLFPLDLIIGNEAQAMRDTIETHPLLSVGMQDVPGCSFRIGGLQHHVVRTNLYRHTALFVPERARSR